MLITLLVLVGGIGFGSAQTTDLTGSWHIVEFAMDNQGNSNKMAEEQLKKDGAVWSLFFMDEGKFKQTSNMRTGEMESQEGSWKTSDDNLALEMLFNEQTINLNYTFKIEENVLVLTRSNPAKTVTITTRFRKEASD